MRLPEAIGEAPLARAPMDEDLSAALSVSRVAIDRVLDDLPEIRLEARRIITRELGLSPTPEQLQTLDSMAHGVAGRGPLRELLRAALALRLVADRALEELLDAPELDAERIHAAAALLPRLGMEIDAIEESVRCTLDGLAPADRECLLQVSHALIPARDLLIAGEVLAPRLELIALAGKHGDLTAAVPTLSDQDVALVATAVAPNESWSDGACRVCINALAMRTVIDDDLASWAISREVQGDDAGKPGTRGWSQARLRRDKIAYGVVSERIQNRQDTALVAGLREFADELSRVKGELFSSYLKLAPALRASTGVADAGPTAEMQSLLDECATTEQLVETAGAGKASKDELYLDALRGLDGKTQAPRITRIVERDVKRERRRLRMMIGIAVVLFVGVLIQYGSRLRAKPADELRVPIADFTGKLFLSEAMAVGPMMYAQITHYSWDSLSEPQRVKRVEDLAILASDRGFEKVYLTDENDQHLASWSRIRGVKLE